MIRGYEHTVNNDFWACKTDCSCGLEVCTPILEGWRSLQAVGEVLMKIQAAGFNVDETCGHHVHLDVRDYDREQVGILIMWWLKFEKVFLHTLPLYRRERPHCGPLTNMDIQSRMTPGEEITPERIYQVFRPTRGALSVQHFEGNKTVNFWIFGDCAQNRRRVETSSRKIGMPSHQNIKYNFMPQNFANLQALVRMIERAFGMKKRKKYDAIFADNKRTASFLNLFYPIHTTKVVLVEPQNLGDARSWRKLLSRAGRP